MDHNNDNGFFEDRRDEILDVREERSEYDRNMGLSAGGNSYGDGGRKSGSLVSILVAIGVGIVVAAVVVALVSPKKKSRRNIADIVSERGPGEVDEMKQFVENKGIVESAAPAQPEAPAEMRIRDRAQRDTAANSRAAAARRGAAPAPAAQKPAGRQVVPSELRLVERPSDIQGEVVVERDNSPAPIKTASAPAPSGGAWTVQLASGDDAKKVEAEWGKLSARHGALLSGATHKVIPAEVNGRQVYRLRVVGFGSFAEADALCSKLKSAGAACYATR